MEEIIGEKLSEIEKAENVKIIHCIESGSRAWGFASPDSDYDVRFIYVRPAEYYLRLDKTSDIIEWQLDDVLDINGWDIKKALLLLHKSNPTLFEWNGSPIVYRTTEQWKKVSDIINGYFIKKSGVHHYLSTAKSNFREYLKGERVRLKKYFYVLRPILACRWIINEQTPPPMLFSELAERYLDNEVKPEVENLLRIKTQTPEITMGKRINALNRYLDKNIEELTELVKDMPEEKSGDWQELNRLFLYLIGQNNL